MKRVSAMVALVLLPLAADALDLTGLPVALAEKVTAARQACAKVEKGEFASVHVQSDNDECRCDLSRMMRVS